MKRNELITKIAEQLKGKRIERGYCAVEWQIKEIIRKNFDKHFSFNITVERPKGENTLYIRYKNYYLFALRFTKTKGEHHWEIGSDYTDYYFKDFSCGDLSGDYDFTTKFNEIENAIADNENKKKQEFIEMLGCYNKIKDLFGDKTDRVLYYIKNHQYSLERGEL